MLNLASDVSDCVSVGDPLDFQRISSEAGGAASSVVCIFTSSPLLILTSSSHPLSLTAQRTVLVACVNICQCFISFLGS